MTHLRYYVQDAPNEHPQQVMKNLGITYVVSTPQSMGDQWWFWCCRNIPDPLPPYLTEIALGNSLRYIGWGLSKEDADIIALHERSGNG